MSPQDEKKLLANIKRLKEQIPNAERLGELAPLIKQLNDLKKPIYDDIKVIKAQLEEKSKELDAVRQEQTEVKEKNNDLTEQLNKLNEAIDKQKADLQEIYNRKDQLREDYHHARYDFEVENAQIKHFEHLARVKEGLLARNKDKQERLAARQQALADRPNPCQKELDTCERLIAYVMLLQKRLGQGGQTEETIKEERKQLINEQAKEGVKQKLNDGKIQQVMSKAEREKAAMITVGGRKKGEKKQGKR